jgi:hypothetical protein
MLSRADGVVFVADSQQTQEVNNGEAFQNLAANAATVGLDFDRLPLVVQFNKRDLPNIVAEDEIRARWSAAPWPLTFASALTGPGVLETFRLLVSGVYRRFADEGGLAGRHGLSEAAFVAGIVGR